MVETLRQCYSAEELTGWLPESFLFFPAKPELSEARLFSSAFDRVKGENKGRSIWIAKPSDGSKGRAIVISEEKSEVLSMFEAEPALEENTVSSGESKSIPCGDAKASAAGARVGERRRASSTGNVAWVVQRYLHRPMLLKGQRKFDIRTWVLVDAEFNVYMHASGVLRTASVPFTLDTSRLGDKFVHLSNHCIQQHSSEYGKFEPTNEMFFDAFRKWLADQYMVRNKQHAEDRVWKPPVSARCKSCSLGIEGSDDTELPPGWSPASLEQDLVPQMHRIVALTLFASRTIMEGAPGASFGSFNLFGYDFMVDEELQVQLLEVNSSPAVAESLLATITRDVISVGIHPFFEDAVDRTLGENQPHQQPSKSGFQKVDCAHGFLR